MDAGILFDQLWRGVFDAIYSGNWASARAGIATLHRACFPPWPRPSSTPPKGRRRSISFLAGPDRRGAGAAAGRRLARLALARGATAAPLIIPQRRVVNLGSAPGRCRARPVQGEPLADQLREALEPLVKANDAAAAEAQLLTSDRRFRPKPGPRPPSASPRSYVNGYDAEAQQVADTWQQGAVGDWAPQAAWVSGLASWRLGDCNAASAAFSKSHRRPNR